MKLKTYVITVSQRFPGYHKRKGEPTNFVAYIYEGNKKHTMRPNFELWEKKFKEIQAGRGKLSIREWLGKPYYSKQVTLRERDISHGISLQKVSVEQYNGILFISIDDKLKPCKLQIISNDGLTEEDFLEWFKKPLIDGALIHFTDFKY